MGNLAKTYLKIVIVSIFFPLSACEFGWCWKGFEVPNFELFALTKYRYRKTSNCGGQIRESDFS